MSFLETMFAQAADGELDVPAGGDDHATYDVPPGVLGMPLHNPTSYLLSMRTKAGSNERKFPREYAKHVDAVALSKGVGHTLVRVLGPMKFVVQKHFTGRQFTVKVGDGRSCTCPECNLDASALVNEKANRICSATLFVLLKVLQIPKESPLIFRKVWREDEIKRVLQSKGEQRGLVLEQNHHQPFSPEVLEAQVRSKGKGSASQSVSQSVNAIRSIHTYFKSLILARPSLSSAMRMSTTEGTVTTAVSARGTSGLWGALTV